MAGQRSNFTSKQMKGTVLIYCLDALVILALIPLVIASVFARRVFFRAAAEQIPWKEDLRRSFLRGSAYVSLATISNFLAPTKLQPIVDSVRFRNRTQNLFLRVVRPDFSGYWICKGPPGKARAPCQCEIVLLWLHGGAYCFGNALDGATSLLYAAEVAAQGGVCVGVFSVEYNLPPKALLLKQQQEVIAAYRYLLSDQKVPHGKIFIGGESAGAHLALSALVGLAQASLSPVGGALLLCPWANLLNDCASFKRNKYSDVLSKNMLDRCAMLVTGTDNFKGLSSISLAKLTTPPGDLSWSQVLPRKTWVQAGDQDVFIDDTVLFVQRAKEQGADIRLDLWQKQPHGWLLFSDHRNKEAYLSSPLGTDTPHIVLIGGHEIAKQILMMLK